MDTVLVIFFLSIRSSYANNSEAPATPGAFDTVQFYATKGSAWRVKTYAEDQDVHIWSFASATKDVVDLAIDSTNEHYGDVLTEGHVIETNDGVEGIRRELAERGLDAHLEITPSGAVFWSPAGTSYRTQTVPQ